MKMEWNSALSESNYVNLDDVYILEMYGVDEGCIE